MRDTKENEAMKPFESVCFDWAYEQIRGDQLLVVGNMQADLPIFLGRKSKKVTGFEAGYESYNRMMRLLEKETPLLKTYVALFQQDWQDDQTCDGTTFHSIILSGTFDVQIDDLALLSSRLSARGRLIMIVPYGRAAGGRSAFYLSDITEFQGHSLRFVTMQFFHTSLGIVFERAPTSPSDTSGYPPVVAGLEQVIQHKESDYLAEISAWQLKLSEQKEATIQLVENHIEQSKNEMDMLCDYHEKILENENLVRELTVMKRKYQALSSSKLGKVTLYFWDLRKKYRR